MRPVGKRRQPAAADRRTTGSSPCRDNARLDSVCRSGHCGARRLADRADVRGAYAHAHAAPTAASTKPQPSRRQHSRPHRRHADAEAAAQPDTDGRADPRPRPCRRLLHPRLPRRAPRPPSRPAAAPVQTPAAQLSLAALRWPTARRQTNGARRRPARRSQTAAAQPSSSSAATQCRPDRGRMPGHGSPARQPLARHQRLRTSARRPRPGHGRTATPVVAARPRPATAPTPAPRTVSGPRARAAGTGVIHGSAFFDTDANGVLDTSEAGLSPTSRSPWARRAAWRGPSLTDDDGAFTFDGLAPGTYHVSMTVPSDYVATTDAGQDVDVVRRRDPADVLFGLLSRRGRRPRTPTADAEMPTTSRSSPWPRSARCRCALPKAAT